MQLLDCKVLHADGVIAAWYKFQYSTSTSDGESNALH